MRRLSDPFRRAGAALVACSIAVGVAACGTTGPSATPSAASSDVAAASLTPAPSDATTSAPPAPTAVPGGQTVDPGPPATHKPTTTVTDWGVILDSVPDDFPRYPGREGR